MCKFTVKLVQATNGNASYAKKLLKKLINEVELENGEVLDEVYEEYALYMLTSKVYFFLCYFEVFFFFS